MGKMIASFGLVALLATLAFAAPVVEDGSALPDINQLLEEANFEDNDITASRTELPIIVEEATTATRDNKKYPAEQKVEVENDKKDEVTTTDDIILTAPSIIDPATPGDTIIDEKEELNTDDTVNKEKNIPEGLVPVTEVIPDPEVAHVLGTETEMAIEDQNETVGENINNYQIIQGENEHGVAFISEYHPEINEPQQEESLDAPIVEKVRYEYPPDNIMPEAVFRAEQILNGTGNVENTDDMTYDDYDYTIDLNGNSDNIVDYSTYTYDEAMDHHIMNSGLGHPISNMGHNIPDYPTDTYMGDMDYTNDYISAPFDESIHYDTQFEPHSPDDYMDVFGRASFHDGYIPQQNLPAGGDYHNVIVAGLNENYHPEPMPGLNLHPGEVLENPDVDYPVYDEPIIPAAMTNIESPAVEETNFSDDLVDHSVPEMPPMVDLLQPVALFPVQQDPMASMLPMASDDFIDASNDTHLELNEVSYDGGLSRVDLDNEPQNGIIVIKFDIKNQKASVNGIAYPIGQGKSIVEYVEQQLIHAATKKRRLPPTNYYAPHDYAARPSNYFYNYDMPMYHSPGSYFDNSPYTYSQYGVDYDPYYEPSYASRSFDPFLAPLRTRMMQSRFNRMRSINNPFNSFLMEKMANRMNYIHY